MSINKEKFVEAMNKELPCRHCGFCCYIRVQISEADIKREPRLLSDGELVAKDDLGDDVILDGPHIQYLMGTEDKSEPCSFLITNNDSGATECGIYSTRPVTCQNRLSTPMDCMIALITSYGIDIVKTMQAWQYRDKMRNLGQNKPLPEAVLCARIYGKYLQLRSIELASTMIVGGETLDQKLSRDLLVAFIKYHTLSEDAVSASIN